MSKCCILNLWFYGLKNSLIALRVELEVYFGMNNILEEKGRKKIKLYYWSLFCTSVLSYQPPISIGRHGLEWIFLDHPIHTKWIDQPLCSMHSWLVRYTVKVKVLLLYNATRPDGFSSAYNLTPGRGLTQPWCEPSLQGDQSRWAAYIPCRASTKYLSSLCFCQSQFYTLVWWGKSVI